MKLSAKGAAALSVVLVALSSVAEASPITYALSNVTFTDGGSALGTITYDPTAQALVSFEITVTDSNFVQSPITLSSEGVMVVGNRRIGSLAERVQIGNDQLIQYSLSCYPAGEIGPTYFNFFVPGITGGGDICVLDNPYDVGSGCFNNFGQPGQRTPGLATGSLVAVPEPAITLLLGCGMLALGGRRRQRREAKR